MKKVTLFLTVNLFLFAGSLEESLKSSENREVSKEFIYGVNEKIEILRKDYAKLVEYLKQKEQEDEFLIEKIATLQSSVIMQGEEIKRLKEELNGRENHTTQNIVKKNLDNGFTNFKPTLFIVTTDTKLYNSPNGDEVKVANKGYKFTSYQKSGNWVRLSGEIVNGKWLAINEQLFINETDIKER